MLEWWNSPQPAASSKSTRWVFGCPARIPECAQRARHPPLESTAPDKTGGRHGVRWTINLDGGATTETINMKKGSLSYLSFGAGVAMASVRLPGPVGTITLTLAGGATQLLVVAQSGAPAQVKAVGGASQVSLDGISHTAEAGGSVFADPAWASSYNRYAIDLLAGFSAFQMSRG
jgi:hypothetical protein